jgi:leucyl aminopeptidase
MKFSITNTSLPFIPAGLSVVFLRNVTSLESETRKRIEEIVLSEKFEDQAGKTLLIRTEQKRILVVGLGKLEELTMYDWQTALAGVARKAKEMNAKTLTIALPIEEIAKKTSMIPEKLIQGTVEGLSLGAYEFLRHKHIDEQKKEKKIEEVTFCVHTKFEKEVQKGIDVGQRTSKATLFARDLVNEPSSVTTPTFLSLIAQSLAKDNPDISCEILGQKEMEKKGMGGILGIAKGSDEEPKLIVLKYQKGQTHHSRNSDFFNSGNEKTIVLVGKGVTFDSGGLSLKSDANMETMKLDMAGAAAILGIFSVLSEFKLNRNIIGLIPAVENMPSGKAIKPGDIVTSYNGKTIEIISTDAEGRVILADALSFAKTFHPDTIIDLATLTGACSIALGEEIAGLFVNEKILADQLLMLGKETGERLWELPLAKEYEELLKSPVADIKNVAKTRAGGAITGALFLKLFVPENVQWAHIDIGGTAWQEKDSALCSEGGTGFGVRLILEYLSSVR